MQFVLDKYLSEVEGHLHTLPPNVRQGEIDEMASHLQQLRTDFLARGHSSEEAEAMALARFGSARKVGLRLRDVWEGNRGVWVTLAAVAVSNWTLQLMNHAAAFWLAFYGPMSNNRALMEPLAPVTIFWTWWTWFLLPFGLNFVLGRWGGRRVALAVPAVMLPLPALQLAFLSLWLGIDVAGAKVSFSSFDLAVALATLGGAWSGSASKRRERFATISGASLEEASARLMERQKWHRRRLVARASTCALILVSASAGAFAVVKARLDSLLRPSTPEAAVRVMLRYPQNGNLYLVPATNVSIRLLPATDEQIKQSERLVSYTATMHASEGYRQARIELTHKFEQYALEGRGTSYTVQECRDSLARLGPEGYTLSRVARVRQTSEGWHVVMGGGSQKPWAWVYDLGYKEPAPAPEA